MHPVVLLAAANAVVLLSGAVAASVVPDEPAADAAQQVVRTDVAPAPVPRAPAEPPPVSPPAGTPTPTPSSLPREVTATNWGPYATAGSVTLHFPGDTVEVVGFHESSHDGAQPQQPLESGVRAGLLESRERDTNGQGAADIVVEPGDEVRAPVTGTVVRAGTYRLYCDHSDHYLVIEPDARPGWEVKLLHFEGLAVSPGDRVEAGVTVVGTGARLLPFDSQIDEFTAEPSWPHVHVEVVDPSVPDRPSGRQCD